jgi:hypothetical protein
MRLLSLPLAFGLVLASAAVAAPVNYISQERAVVARAGETTDTSQVPAVDFGAITIVASASAVNEDTSVRADARLTSDLTQTVMSFVGRLELQGEDLDPSDDVLDNLGQSANTHNTIVFELTLPHTFRSVQSFTAEGESDRQGIALLSGPGGFSEVLAPGTSGRLEVGEYRLDFNHDIGSEAGIPLTASVDFVQTVELAVIPLPAALWPGLALLAAIVAGSAYRKRHGRE